MPPARAIRRIRPETLMQSVAFGVLLTVACRALGFGRGVLLVRILDPAALGAWALMANAVQVLGFVFAFGVPSGMSRYVGRLFRTGSMTRTLLPVGVGLVLLIALVCGVAAVQWEGIGEVLFSSSASRGLVLLTLAAVVATVAFSMVGGALQGLKLFRANSLFELVQNAGFLLLTVALFFAWESSVLAPAWAHLAATVLVTLIFGFWLKSRLSAGPDSPVAAAGASHSDSHWQPLVVFSLGTWCAGSLQAISRAIDRYMLLHLAHSPEAGVLDQIGQYFVASKLGQPISAVAGVLAMALLPHAAGLWEEKRHEEVQRMIRLATKLAAVGMTLGGVVLVLNKQLLFNLIAGRSLPYSEAVLVAVLATTIAVSMHYIVRNYLFCREEAWMVTTIWLVCLLANVGLNWALIPRFELAGATAATAASSALAMALTMAAAQSRGLRLDRGTYFAAASPALLFVPPLAMIVGSLGLVVATLGTSAVLTRDEKQTIRAWLSRQRERVGLFRPWGTLAKEQFNRAEP